MQAHPAPEYNKRILLEGALAKAISSWFRVLPSLGGGVRADELRHAVIWRPSPWYHPTLFIGTRPMDCVGKRIAVQREGRSRRERRTRQGFYSI